MHLVQILLPVRDNAGSVFRPGLIEDVVELLAVRFGGVTAYDRAPADGRWCSSGRVQHDEVVVLEVMVDQLDRAWWRDFRADLEKRFEQEQLIVRAETIELL
jgi:hypothetical protein